MSKSSSDNLVDFAVEFISTDGGEYSSTYCASNMFEDNSSVYCTTKDKNINVIGSIKFPRVGATEDIPVITQVVVRAPKIK